MRVLASIMCLLALAGCGREPPSKERKLEVDSLIDLDLRSALPELDRALLGEGRPSHLDALLRTRKFAADPLARGLFVRLGSFAGHFADVDDWAAVFEAFRKQKKPVHCHFDELDNGGYALASHCDRLSMTPAGLLNLVGLAEWSATGEKHVG